MSLFKTNNSHSPNGPSGDQTSLESIQDDTPQPDSTVLKERRHDTGWGWGEQAGLGAPTLALGAPPGNLGQWVSSSGLARGPPSPAAAPVSPMKRFL